MADFRTPPTQLTPLTTAATEFAFAASAVGAVENDYIVIWLLNAATAGTISEKTTSAWTITTLNVASGQRMALAYLKVGAGAPADVTFQANSGLWQAAYAVVFDADPTTFNAGTITTSDGGLGTSAATGALTPSSDDALVMYFAGVRSGGTSNAVTRFLSSEVVGECMQAIEDAGGASVYPAIAIGTWQQGAAAATSKTYYTTSSSRHGSIVLAIKNKTSGKRAKHGVAGLTRIGWMGNFSGHDGITWGLPDNETDTPTSWDGSGKINGIGVSNNVVTKSDAVTSGPNPFGLYSSIASTLNTAGHWVGIKGTLGATLDMTGAVFSIEHYIPSATSPRIGAEGSIVAFRDSTGDWAAFQLSQKLGQLSSMVSQIAVETATPYAYGGAISWNDITSISLFSHRVGSSATSATGIGWRNMLKLTASTLVGGNATNPLSIEYLDKVLNGWGYINACRKQGTAIMQGSKVQFGNASTPTYLDISSTLTSFQSAYNKLTQRETNITANAVELRLKPGASDTILFGAASVVGAVQQNLIVDSGSATPASFSSSGLSAVGMRVTDEFGLPWNGAVFKGGDTVTLKNSVSGITVSNTVGAVPAVSMTANGKTIASSTIDVTGTSATYHLSLSSGVTAITLNGVTFTGSAATDKIYSALASGTLTITTDGTGTTLVAGDVTFVGGSTAVAVIAAPELYQSVTVSGAIANSQIHVADVDYTLTVSGITITPTAGATYTHNDITWTVVSASITAGAGTIVVYGLGSPAESGTLTKASGTGDASVAFSAFVRNVTTLYNGAPTFPYTWTDSVAASAARAIRLRVAYCQTTSARAFIESYIGVCGIADGSESISYNASQVADATYNTHALDGPAILALGEITISDLGTDLITVDTAGGTMGWPTIYAAFVAWMASSSGIDDEIAYCDSPDPVNFIWENTRIKCPLGTALSVTDGWGRDSVTGLSITLWDNTGGAIGFSADHGIGYSTGSGLTSGQNAKLMALPSATDIAQEVVTGITF